MPSLRLHLAVAALIVPMGLAGCSSHMNATEKMMWSTYALATEKGAATGFVVKCPQPAPSGEMGPVLVTSSHVLETLGDGPLLIILRAKSEDGEAEPVCLVLVPPKTSWTHCYVRHPAHDVAAFAMHLPPDVVGIADVQSFVSQGMLPHNGRSLRSGTDVAFLGYPEVLPGTSGAFPVLRSGRVASYPVGTAQAHGRFLIDADVYPGDSGAPVIIAGRNGSPDLVGMIIQRVSSTASSSSHLAVAVDADVIRETLQLLAESEKRPVEAQSYSPAEPSS